MTGLTDQRTGGQSEEENAESFADQRHSVLSVEWACVGVRASGQVTRLLSGGAEGSDGRSFARDVPLLASRSNSKGNRPARSEPLSPLRGKSESTVNF